MNRRRFTQQLAAAAGAISLGRTMRGAGMSLAPGLAVDGERINRQLRELSAFGKNPYGGVSRVAYSEFDRQGRAWAMNIMRETGLVVSIDAAGNIFGRRPGSVATLKPLVFEGNPYDDKNRVNGTMPLGQLALTTEVENFPSWPAGDSIGTSD